MPLLTCDCIGVFVVHDLRVLLMLCVIGVAGG